MNVWFKILILNLVCILSFSCEEEDISYDIGAYKVDLATVVFDNGLHSFLLDSGESLYTSDQQWKIEKDQRVWLNYSYLSEEKPGYDRVVKVNVCRVITQGKPLITNQETIDIFRNDPVYLRSVWLGSTYLNLDFSFDFYSNPHKIALLMADIQQISDTIMLYFRHSTGEDLPGYERRSYASFDLSEILGLSDGSRLLFVNINSTNYGAKNFDLRY